MVLYNSPAAVGLLVAVLLFVSMGVTSGHFRLFILARADHSPLGDAIRREALRSLLTIFAVVLFWVLLATAAYREAFLTAPSFWLPEQSVEWSPGR